VAKTRYWGRTCDELSGAPSGADDRHLIQIPAPSGQPSGEPQPVQVYRCECQPVWLAALYVTLFNTKQSGGGPYEPVEGEASSTGGGILVAVNDPASCDVNLITYHDAPSDHFSRLQGGAVKLFSIRSTHAFGEVVDFPVNVVSQDWTGNFINVLSSIVPEYDAIDLDITVPLKTGLDTGGQWRRLEVDFGGDAVPEGFELRAYIAAVYPPECEIPEAGEALECEPPPFAPYGQVPEYGIPHPLTDTDCVHLATDVWTKTFATAGPIQWRGVIPLVDADTPIRWWDNPALRESGAVVCGGCDPFDNSEDESPEGIFLAHFAACRPGHFVNWAAFCLDPVFGIYEVPPLAQDQTDCKQNLVDACGSTVVGIGKKRAFNRAVFGDLPTPKTTDDTWTLNILAYNPFTWNRVDGTHPHADEQEEDVDTEPRRELYIIAGENVGDNIAMSLVRNSFGDYTATFQMTCKAGTRKFKIFYQRERLTNIPVTEWKVDTTEIVVTHGTAKRIAFKKIFANYPYKYQIGEVIQIDGEDVTGIILDLMGAPSFNRKYNTVLNATNSVDLEFEDNGGNAISSPSLNGTYPKNAVAGVATFDDLAAVALGRNYTIRMVVSGLSGSINTDWFHEFYPQFYIGLEFSDPGTVVNGVPALITVTLKDADGNTVSPDTVDDLTLDCLESGVTGLGDATPVLGVATWLVTFPSAGTYTLTVVTSGDTYDGPPATTELEVVVS
jgi:hypothetical protein